MRYYFLILITLSGLSFSQEPTTEKVVWGSFSTAKKRARDIIYAGHDTTFYCSCGYTASSATGGKIQVDSCGYYFRKSESRGSRLEWEHVVPASFFGQTLPCWTEGHEDCKKKGRACCGKVNHHFHEAEVDLHNLVPAVGEINGDRSNYPYGIVDGEPRVYGVCDFELGGDPKVAEPKEDIRGNIARIWLYMIETYDVPISEDRLLMLNEWNLSDPVDAWEIERNKRIKELQGNGNRFVEGG